MHALWSDLFFQKYVVGRFPELGEAGLCAQYHHKPETLHSADEPEKEGLAAIVQEADRLAAQFDREKRPKDDPKGSPTFDRLEAVTERVAVTEEGEKRRNEKRARWYYPLVPLSISETPFPVEVKEDEHRQSLKEEYAKLWGEFIKEYDSLPGGSVRAYFDSLVYLLHKYTWSIPSATYVDYPSISLYDHSRVTAALAVCLYDVKSAGEQPDKEFILIEGDISGIQQFIYNPAFNGQELQSGIARRLRGRSFYLNLLLKTLTDFIIGELELYSVNILWATGGHFFIIAPNTAHTSERLRAAREKIEKWLWNEYRGALGIIIADCPAGRDELRDFGQLRERIGRISSALKLQQTHVPLACENDELDDAWSDPFVLKMRDDICRDTGRDLSASELEISEAWQRKWGEDEPVPRSLQSLYFDAIGRTLVKTQTLHLRRDSGWQITDGRPLRRPRTVADISMPEHGNEMLLIEFPALNRCWLLAEKRIARSDAHLSLRIADHRNKAIEFLSAKSGAAAETAQGFEMIADAVALDERSGSIVEFHDLADMSTGGNFLGVLRMDVDNLGYLFAAGLPKSERSISKIANISRMFDFFFIGYLNTLVADRPLYTTYAGGDDLFIVGAWSEILDLAETIQQRFTKFCANNPDLHISGGIALCKGKFPIGRAAADAGHLLDQVAKTDKQTVLTETGRREILKDDTDKNALAFLERKISWKKWPEVRAIADELIAAIEAKKVSRKFVYNLLELYRQHIDPYRNPADRNPGVDLIWMPRFLYSLTRNVSDKELRSRLQTAILEQQDYLSLLAGYVSLKTRGSSKSS